MADNKVILVLGLIAALAIIVYTALATVLSPDTLFQTLWSIRNGGPYGP